MSNCEFILKQTPIGSLTQGKIGKQEPSVLNAYRFRREKNDSLLGKPSRQGAKGVVRRNVISFVICATC